MNRLKRSLVLSGSVSAAALATALNALADSFTITPSPPAPITTTTQILNTTGDVGTVEAGGVIDVISGNGIEGTADGVTVNNAGSVTSDETGILVLSSSSINNAGSVTSNGVDGSGIATSGSNNTITNSGTVKGDVGIFAEGADNTINNSETGVVSDGEAGIVALGTGNKINNSGTVTGHVGIGTQGNGNTINNLGTATSASDGFAIGAFGDGTTITNAGTAEGGTGIFAQGVNNTIINSGTVTGSFIRFGIVSYGNGTKIINSGAATGAYGIYTEGDDNTIVNSGTATGTSDSFGIVAFGDGNKITNSGTAEGGAGMYVEGTGNTIINAGTMTGASDNFGIVAYGDGNTITNSGTTTAAYAIYAGGAGNTITNSGKIIGNLSAVAFSGSANTLTLLSGSNVQGLLDIAGTGGNRLVIGRGLSTALTYTGGDSVILDTSGMPFVSSNGVLAVVDPTLFSAGDDMLNDLTRSLADVVDTRLASARSGHSASNMVAATPAGIVPTADVPGAAEPQAVIWAAGIGNHRSQSSSGIYDGFDTTLGGFALGADGALSSGTRLGGFAGASFANLSTDAGTQEIDSDSYYAGLYAGFTVSEAFLNLALTGGYTNQSTSRDVLNNLVAGGVEHAEGDPSGFFISPSATIGTDIDTGDVILTPSLRARYAGLFLESYDESGSTADLSVNSRSVNLFDLRGQLAFAIEPVVTSGGQFDAALRLGADATFTNSDDIDATLLGQSLTFNASEDDTTVRGFAGLDLAYGMDGGASLTLSGEAGYDTSDAVTLMGSAGLAWSF